MLRRLLIGFAILLGLLALADRALASFAGQGVGRVVQQEEDLPERPDVSFRGFPFATQAVRGRFREIDLVVRDLRREGLTITRIDAELRGVEIGLGDALSGEVAAVPVEQGRATVALGYADLNAFLATRAGDPSLRPAGGGGLSVSVSVGVPGQGSVRVTGTGTLEVTGAGVRVTARSVRRDDGGTLPSAALAEATRRLRFDIPLADLPFGIRITGVRVTPDAIEVDATATGIVISAR